MGIINDFFGMILNLIFEGVALLVPVGTLGVTIIIFTLVTRLLLTPLQLKQQRTTRAMSKIQPELQKLQRKYANKKDQASQMAYSQEMQAIYKKYKISPLSGCLPLLIQLPLIYALYNVLRQPSRYINALGELYTNMADQISNLVPNINQVIEQVIEKSPLSSTAIYELQKLQQSTQGVQLSDTLSHFTTDQWGILFASIPANVQENLAALIQQKHDYEWFLVNLIDSPAQLVAGGMVLALLVPVAAGASSFIFSKITMASSRTTQPSSNSGEPNTADTMMKVMNIMMPIMMGVFSYSVPSGLALYWIAGNIIMLLQQIWVNKIVDKQDKILEEQLKKERAEQAAKKKKPRPEGQRPKKSNPQSGEQGEKPRKPRAEGEDNRKPKPKGQAAGAQKPRQPKPQPEVKQSDSNQLTSEAKNLNED